MCLIAIIRREDSLYLNTIGASGSHHSNIGEKPRDKHLKNDTKIDVVSDYEQNKARFYLSEN